MANIVVTETASNISVNSTSNVVTVTNTPANIEFATVSAVSNAAVREALSVTDTGGDGSLSYANATGIFTYTGPNQTEANARIAAAPTQVRAHIGNTLPITYDSSTGVIGFDQNLSNLTLQQYQETIVNGGNVSGNISANIAAGTIHQFTLTGNVTKLELDNIQSGGSATIFLNQDTIGNNILDTTTHSVEWSNWDFVNDFSSLDVTANAFNILNVLYDGSKYYASLVVDSEISPDSLVVSGNITGGNIHSNAAMTTATLVASGNITSNANIEAVTLKGTGATGLVVSGNATIGGNLDVTGNINSETVVDLFVEDRNITLQFGATGTPSANSQIFVDRGSAANTFIIWNESNDKFGFSNDGSNITYLAQTTDDLTEGSTNLYFTTARTNTSIAAYTGGMENMTGNIVAGNANINNSVNIAQNSGANAHLTLHANTSTTTKPNVEIFAPGMPRMASTPTAFATRLSPIGLNVNGLGDSNVVPGVSNNFTVDLTDLDFFAGNITGSSKPIQLRVENSSDFTVNPSTDLERGRLRINKQGNNSIQTAFTDILTHEDTQEFAFNFGQQVTLANGATINTGKTITGAGGIDVTGNIETSANISGGNILGTVRGAINSTSNITTTANISGGNVLGTFIGNITGNVTGSPSSLAGLDTGDLAEGTNLYYTTDRANTAIGAYTGAITNMTGNLTTTANISAGNVVSTFIGNITGNVTGSPSSLAGLDTADLAEGTNLYFTNARANAAFVDSLDNITTTISSNSNITTTGNITGGNVLTDAVTSGASANLTLTGQQNGVHLNKTISSVNSQIIDVDTTGYAVGEASPGLPATTTLGTSAMALLVSINHTAGSPTATVNDIYAGALAGVGLDVPAVRGPDFNTGLTGGDIIMTAESGTAGRGNLEAAMTTEGSTSPFIGSPAKSGIANASANLYGQDKGWTIFNISNGSRSDLFPVQAHITGVVNDTITFSENAIASGTTTVALQPGMAQSTVANTNIKFVTQIGDKATANSGINGNTLYGYLGSFEHPETLANLTYDRLSYSNTSTITFTSIDMKQSADMNSGGDSAVRYPRLLSVGPNTTPDPFSGRVETNNPSPIGVTVEDDGETYASNNAPYSKFLFNTYTGAFDDMTIHPNWATVGNTGNVTLDLPQLKAPSLQFKTFRGEKSDGNLSNYLMQAGEVVGKVQFSPGQTTGLGFQGADLYNPPAAITVDVGNANINTGAANTHMHITTSPYPHGGSLGYFRNNANAVSGINQQTNFTTKDGNVTIAAQTDGRISLAPTPDYGDSGNATVWTRFPGTTHEFHRFLDARFNTANATSKEGTVVEIQPASGTTTGSGGLGYNSVGDATLKLTTHEANSALLKSYTITNNRTSNTLVLKNNASSVDAFEISDSRNIHGQTVKLHNLTTTQINALSSPQAGDMVFNTTLNQVCVYNGSGWRKLTDDAM